MTAQEKAQEYLSQARHLDQLIKNRLSERDILKATITDCTHVNTGMPRNPGRPVSSLENTIVKLCGLESEINREIDALVDLKKEIRHVINAVGNFEYQKLLELRYIKLLEWDDIAAELKYSPSNVYKLHKKALAAVVVPEISCFSGFDAIAEKAEKAG